MPDPRQALASLQDASIVPYDGAELVTAERQPPAIRFQPGQVVVRRDIVAGEVWFAFATICVADTPDLLALYLPTGVRFGFPDEGTFRYGRHPYLGKHESWAGHGKLMLHQPGEAHSVDVFWSGEGGDRRFAGWYFNLQDPYRRTSIGIDTLDHELDLWWPAGEPRYQWKDVDKFEERVAEGWYSGQAEQIRAEGRRIADLLDAGQRWWDPAWADWEPDPAWCTLPQLPAGWMIAPGSA